MTASRMPSRNLPRLRAHWSLLLPLLLLVTFMAAQGLNADLIWYDELTSISHAGGVTGPFSPKDVMDSVREHSPKHTPLFFELVAGWGALVGWHHAVLRCLPLFFGVIALAWTFRLGLDFIDGWTGIWAAAFLGLNVFWLDYLHEIRMYTMQFMLIMALAWHYFYLVRYARAARRHHWVGLTLSAALCLYAQPFSIFFLLALGSYHLLFTKRSKAWLQVALAMIVAGLLFLPWLPVTLTGLSAKFDTAYDAITFEQAISIFVRLLSNGNWIILLLAVLAALLQLRRPELRRRNFPFLWLALIVLALLLAANEAFGLIPLRRSRYFFVSWTMWALVIGSGLARLKPRWIAPLILTVYLVSGFALRRADDYLLHQGTVGIVNAYPPLADYVEALRGKTEGQDFVVGFTQTDFVNARGKRGKTTADYYMEQLLGIDGTFVPTGYDAEALATDLPRKLDNHPHLLITYDPTSLPANHAAAKALMLKTYRPCDVVLDRPKLFVQRFTLKAMDCNRGYQPIHYENGIRIVDKFAEFSKEEDSIQVVTGWEVPHDEQLELFNVSIQIITPDWQNVAQAPDRHLYDKVLKWYVVELSTAHLAPGDYRVVVIVYDRYHSSAKVNGTDLTTGEVGTILPLLHFTVEY